MSNPTDEIDALRAVQVGLLAQRDRLATRLKEARALLLHFQFIAHGPGCACAMCARRTAFLALTSTSTQVTRASRPTETNDV